MNIRQATEQWVSEWNAVPTAMVFESMMYKPEDWTQLTQIDDEPTWGWMWNMGDTGWDNDWVEENVDVFEELGLILFEHEEYGYWFGVDAGGFDFYEAYWIPLYKARGLRWHDEKEEEK